MSAIAGTGWRLVWMALCLVAQAAHAFETPLELAGLYRLEVDRQLQVPAEDGQRYAVQAEEALARAGARLTAAQYLLVVDRNPHVQAILLYWRSQAGGYTLVGASAVSTGRPGTFDHFETPLGVFEHSLQNPDYRAEGTRNSLGVRGYGVKGMRVYDFGWQQAARGWGKGAVSVMRLQMHATDPDHLEGRLGSWQSKGCVRIPASLNRFIDRRGLLDASYREAPAGDARLWVLQADADTPVDAGRYLVVVDSMQVQRPVWSPGPTP